MPDYRKDKINSLHLRYMFIKKNKEIEYYKISQDKDIWPNRFWYFMLIIDTIDSKNRVNFDVVTLSDSNLRRIISLFKKKGFILKLQLKWDSCKVYYLNPFYAHVGKWIPIELYEAFNEVNWGKVY